MPLTVAGPWGIHTPLPFYPTLCGHPEVERHDAPRHPRCQAGERGGSSAADEARACMADRRECPRVTEVHLQAIGFVRSGRESTVDRGWGAVESVIDLLPQFAEGLEGLEDF